MLEESLFVITVVCLEQLGALGAFLSDGEVSAECEKGVRGCSYPLVCVCPSCAVIQLIHE